MEMMVSARTDSLRFDNAGLLALKLWAFVAMLVDHVDWFFWGGQGVHAGVGRLVFPIFGAVLAYNIARVDLDKVQRVIVPRLLVLAGLTQPVYAFLQGGWLPVNIMATLAVGAASYVFLMRGNAWALVGCLLAGVFVDYLSVGAMGVGLLAYMFRTQGERGQMLVLFLWVSGVALVTQNAMALLAVPLIWAVAQARWGDAPRLKWLFLAGYPLHLLVLAGWKLWA